MLLAGQGTLKHLEIFTGKGIQMMIITDKCGRLQLVNQWINLIVMPVDIKISPVLAIPVHMVPVAVKPDAAYRPVVGQQFGQLCFHEINIVLPVAVIRAAQALTGTSTRVVIRMVPI